MLETSFSIASRPAEIPHHDGVTHLMFAPEASDDATAVERWNGLAHAITQAGGHVQVIENHFNYSYARDLAIVIGRRAFHPTVPPLEDGYDIDDRRRAFLPFLEHYGYQTTRLPILPDYSMDGGNFVHLSHYDLILSGNHMIVDDPVFDDPQATRMKRLIGIHSDMETVSLGATIWHIDSVAGELPDGRILIKLDELEHEDSLKDAGIHDAYLSLVGVRAHHVDFLADRIGRRNIVTFSLYDHPDADVVCGPESLNGSNFAARAFGLAANCITVNGTMVCENLPKPLEARLKSDGIAMITPKDVGVETFLFGDEGHVGAARCLTLQVRHQKRPSPFYT